MCSRVFKAFQETRWRFKTLAFVANGVKLQNRNLNFHVLEVLGGGGLIAPNSSWVNTSSGASRECNRRVKSFTFPFSVSFSLNLSHSLAHTHSLTHLHTHTHTHLQTHTHTHALTHSHTRSRSFLSPNFLFFFPLSLSRAVFSKFLETLTQCLKSVKTIFVQATNKS